MLECWLEWKSKTANLQLNESDDMRQDKTGYLAGGKQAALIWVLEPRFPRLQGERLREYARRLNDIVGRNGLFQNNASDNNQ